MISVKGRLEMLVKATNLHRSLVDEYTIVTGGSSVGIPSLVERDGGNST